MAVHVTGVGSAAAGAIRTVLGVPITTAFKGTGQFANDNEKEFQEEAARLGRDAPIASVAGVARSKSVRFICLIDASNVKVGMGVPPRLTGAASVSIFDVTQNRTVGAPQSIAIPPTNIATIAQSLITLAVSATADAALAGAPSSQPAAPAPVEFSGTSSFGTSYTSSSASPSAQQMQLQTQMRHQTSPHAPRAKPRLRIGGFQIGDGNDGRIFAAILSIQDTLLSAFNIVADDAEYVISGRARSLGYGESANVFIVQIVSERDNTQLAGESIIYRTVEEIAKELPAVAARLASRSPVLSSPQEPTVVRLQVPLDAATLLTLPSPVHTLLIVPQQAPQPQRLTLERPEEHGGWKKQRWAYLGGSLGFGEYEQYEYYCSGVCYGDYVHNTAVAAEFVADFPLLAPVLSLESGVIIGNADYGLSALIRIGFLSEAFEITWDMIGFTVGSMGPRIGSTIGFKAGPGMLFFRYRYSENWNNYSDRYIYTFLVGYKAGVGRVRR